MVTAASWAAARDRRTQPTRRARGRTRARRAVGELRWIRTASSWSLQFDEHLVTKAGKVGQGERQANGGKRWIDAADRLAQLRQRRRVDARHHIDQHGAMADA